MDSWLLLLPAGKRVAELADLRRLAVAWGARVSFVVVECESAAAGEAERASIERALKRHPGAVGCVVFDFGLLPLLGACPGRMRRVLLLDSLPGWEPSAPLAMLEQVLREAAECAKAFPVDFCAAASRVWAGLASLLFPEALQLPPLPCALPVASPVTLRVAKGPSADPQRMPSLGMLVEGGAAYEAGLEQLLAVWAAQLGLEDDADALNRVVSAQNADAFELRLTPGFARQAEPAEGPGFCAVSAVEVASGRSTTGGECMLFPLSACLQAEQGARLAAAEGASLVAWLPPSAGVVSKVGARNAGRLLGASAGEVSVAAWAAEPRSVFPKTAAAPVVPARAQASIQAWESLFLGSEQPASVASAERAAGWLVSPLWYEAWVDAAASPDERALRAWLTRPDDASALLSLAASEAQRDFALAWRLIQMAHDWVRLGAARPEAPPSLCSAAARLFVAPAGATGSAWRDLRDWLSSLAPRDTAPRPLRTRAFAAGDGYPPPGGLEVVFSSGLVRRGSGRYACSGRGFLAVLSLTEAEVGRLSAARQKGGRLALSFSVLPASKEWLSGLDLRVNGHPLGAWVDVQGEDAHLTLPLPAACELSERIFLQGLAASPPETEVTLADLVLATSETAFGVQALGLAHRIALDRTPAAEGVFDVESGADGPSRWVDAEFALALPFCVRPELLRVDTLVLRFMLPPDARATGLPRQISLGGESRPLHPARGAGTEAWFMSPIAWPPSEPGAMFRVQTGLEAKALAPSDPRVAAGLLTGAWLAQSEPKPVGDEAPQGMRLPLEDQQLFSMGWHPAEPFEDRVARWMGPSASVLLPSSVAASGSFAFLLSGPCIPFNATDVPLLASHGGAVMEEHLYEVSDTRWFRLFVTTAPIDPALLAVEVALVAEHSRALGPSDPRIASSLVDCAAVVSLVAEPAASLSEGLVVPLQSLVHENWGIGLVGSWLPAESAYLFAGSAAPLRICVEGAAATSRFAVEGLQALVDDEPVRGTHAIAQDGSWRKVFVVPAGRAQGAHLLRLRSPEIPDADAPGRTRVMLRSIFTESLEAGAVSAAPALAAAAPQGVS